MTHYSRQVRQETIARTFAARIRQSIKLRLTAVTLAVIFLTFGGGAIYLMLINNVATTGFEIKTLEQKVDQLRQDNRRLELEATELQSLAIVESATDQLGLTEVAQVKYLSPTGTVVARK
ncbi:MAG: hypothetical protein V1853_02380 [bacterium]